MSRLGRSSGSFGHGIEQVLKLGQALLKSHSRQALPCHMENMCRAETTPTDVAPGRREQEITARHFSVHVCPSVMPCGLDCLRLRQYYWRLFVRTSKPIPPKISQSRKLAPYRRSVYVQSLTEAIISFQDVVERRKTGFPLGIGQDDA